MDDGQFGLACVMLWNICNFRNRIIHDSVFGKRDTIVARSSDFLNSYSFARFIFPLQT